MGFYDAMKTTRNKIYRTERTENGAVGYKTAGKVLLDLNFAISSMRWMDEQEIVRLFSAAWKEDQDLALRWLFFLRDVRGGMGERQSFRIILKWLARNNSSLVNRLIAMKLIPFYGRWDDVFCVVDECPTAVRDVVSKQLDDDYDHMLCETSVSLLAKWMPSNNTSSTETVSLAKKLTRLLGLTPKQYRKKLSTLRRYLKIVERQMSAGQWNEIDYEAVPSMANLIYSRAFLEHDRTRRRRYLADLSSGKVKINALVAFPHEIYDRADQCLRWGTESEATVYEAMWKALVADAAIDKNVIVVADGSGSMLQCIDQASNVVGLSVANALAFYFAELLPGEFHNRYITFSRTPQLVDLNKCDSLCQMIQTALKHCEIANTNIEAVFDLILKTAVDSGTVPGDMPEAVLVISDMEFDDCVEGNHGLLGKVLFETIAERYASYGYKLPRLVFWNVCGRTRTVPVIENEFGVALVSGFSINNLKMILSGELDPYECLLETLNDKRYDPVAEVLHGVSEYAGQEESC